MSSWVALKGCFRTITGRLDIHVEVCDRSKSLSQRFWLQGQGWQPWPRTQVQLGSQLGCQIGSLLGLSCVQVESEVLLVQALFAEVEELEFPREVLPHYVFGCLQTKIRYDLEDQDKCERKRQDNLLCLSTTVMTVLWDKDFLPQPREVCRCSGWSGRISAPRLQQRAKLGLCAWDKAGKTIPGTSLLGESICKTTTS